jgi:hypothetical protein
MLFARFVGKGMNFLRKNKRIARKSAGFQNIKPIEPTT